MTEQRLAESTEIEARLGDLKVIRQADWLKLFPNLIQGITKRAADLDFGSRTPVEELPPGGEASAENHWGRLCRAAGIDLVVRLRQVHGARVLVAEASAEGGVMMMGEADALVTGGAGALLAISVADCVPIFMVDPERQNLALAHAGWRGTAAGVVEATLERLQDLGSDPGALYVHLGPAICGECYEVGPEVAAALLEAPQAGRFVDLRACLTRDLVAANVDPRRLSVSRGCTLHDSQDFFSYRGGDKRQRMCAFLGWPAG